MVRDGWVNVRTKLGRRRLLAYDDCTMMSCANTLIQGTGADILKVAIANLSEHLGEDARLVACVHDELVLEVNSAIAERYKRLLSRVMVEAEQTVLKTVPSSADASIGDSWADK